MTKEEITELIGKVKKLALIADELESLVDNYVSLEKKGSYLSISSTAMTFEEFLHPDWMHRPSWCGTFDFPHRRPPVPEVRNEAIGTDIKGDVAEILLKKVQEGLASVADIVAVESTDGEAGASDGEDPEGTIP